MCNLYFLRKAPSPDGPDMRVRCVTADPAADRAVATRARPGAGPTARRRAPRTSFGVCFSFQLAWGVRRGAWACVPGTSSINRTMPALSRYFTRASKHRASKATRILHTLTNARHHILLCLVYHTALRYAVVRQRRTDRQIATHSTHHTATPEVEMKTRRANPYRGRVR